MKAPQIVMLSYNYMILKKKPIQNELIYEHKKL